MQTVAVGIWRIGLGVVVLVLVWRIVVWGVSEHFAAESGIAPLTAAKKTLAWDTSNAGALYVTALAALPDDPATAVDFATRSIENNPTDARPLVVLANAFLAQGLVDRADGYAASAAVLTPVDATVLVGLADYWTKRNQAGKALEFLSTVLQVNPGLATRAFPLLLQVAESADSREILAPLAKTPPEWWEDFYAYAVRRAVSLETVAVLTTMRRKSQEPLSPKERSAAVARLQQDNEWPAAYLTWVNGLTQAERRYLGSVYNGGFEGEMSSEGFDWSIRPVKGVEASRQHTYGIRGEKALHIVFSGHELRFKHLWQPVFLAPGDYRFWTMVRPDRLQGRGGLKWVIRCVDALDESLGESARFLGASEWRWSQFDFSVPMDGCAAQVLRLESDGRTSFDHRLEGEVWFDQVAIRPINSS